MATKLQNHLDHASHSIFHHGLIKLLVLNKLRKRNWTWLHFLFWSGFEVKKTKTLEDQNVENGKEEKIPSTQKELFLVP